MPAESQSPARPSRALVLAGAAIALVAFVVGLSIVIDRAGGQGDGSGRGAVAAGGSSTTRPAPPSTSTSTTSSTTTSTTTSAPPTTTTTTPAPAAITLAFAGDLLPHLPLVDVAAGYGRGHGDRYDFKPMLAPMRPIIEGTDIAICHMETPVAPDQDRLSGYPAFGAPVELVDAAKVTGYDGCSTASNHSLDQGRPGIAATLDRFDLDHLRHAGTARTPEEGAAVTMYDAKGVRVAHLSYAYGFNGYRIPADAPWAVNQIDVDRIHRDATAARRAGAQLVVVSLHWGTEYQHAPDGYQRDVAARLLPWPDIDVVIGHHAHVVQPIEQVEGTFVVFGLGNQLANQQQVPKSDGLTVVLHAQRRPDGRYGVASIEAVPTWIEPGTFRVLPIVRTLQDPATSAALRQQLAASYDRTAAVLDVAHHPGITLAPRP